MTWRIDKILWAEFTLRIVYAGYVSDTPTEPEASARGIGILKFKYKMLFAHASGSDIYSLGNSRYETQDALRSRFRLGNRCVQCLVYQIKLRFNDADVFGSGVSEILVPSQTSLYNLLTRDRALLPTQESDLMARKESLLLYPPSPMDVPAELTAPSDGYRTHAILVLMGLFCFFFLYIGLILVCVLMLTVGLVLPLPIRIKLS